MVSHMFCLGVIFTVLLRHRCGVLGICVCVALIFPVNPASAQTPPDSKTDSGSKAAQEQPATATPKGADEDQAKSRDKVVYLLQPKEFPKGWQSFTADGTITIDKLWQLAKDQEPKEAVLICNGKTDGYLRTEQEFEDFELSLEWKYPSDPNGNSGILLHTVEKDMIWPKGVQVQLHRPTAGSVFASSGAKLDNTLPAKDLSLPINEWNACVITSQGGRLSVTVNGKKVGEVTGCSPHRGTIGLQSEGSEIHFRRLWIRPLAATEISRNQRLRRAMSANDAPVLSEELCAPLVTIKKWSANQPRPLTQKQETTRAKQEAQKLARQQKRQDLAGQRTFDWWPFGRRIERDSAPIELPL